MVFLTLFYMLSEEFLEKFQCSFCRFKIIEHLKLIELILYQLNPSKYSEKHLLQTLLYPISNNVEPSNFLYYLTVKYLARIHRDTINWHFNWMILWKSDLGMIYMMLPFTYICFLLCWLHVSWFQGKLSPCTNVSQVYWPLYTSNPQWYYSCVLLSYGGSMSVTEVFYLVLLTYGSHWCC